MHILGGGARTFDDDVGVLLKDAGPAGPQTLAAGLLQKPSGRLAAFGL